MKEIMKATLRERMKDIEEMTIKPETKLTAKQIYSQGYQAGEMADKTDVWNEAIEAAARMAETKGMIGMAKLANDIRKLHK